MQKKISSVAICFDDSPQAHDAAQSALSLLARASISIFGSRVFALGDSKSAAHLRNAQCDLVFAFGNGNRAIFQAFQLLGESQVPVMGVACGEKGFLADVELREFSKLLSSILEGKFEVEERARLKCIGENFPLALNEVAIVPAKNAVLMRYGLKVDEEFLWQDFSDGLVVATPTGSTAHSLSAGGPIISFNTRAFVLTPLGSVGKVSPLVVSDSSVVEVYNIHSAGGCEVVIDGRFRAKISGSKVAVKKSKFPALVARLHAATYAPIAERLGGKRKAKSLSTPGTLKDATPATKFVLRLLEYEGALTQKEIVNSTQLPARTVRRSLESLLHEKRIAKRPLLEDPRQDLYSLA